MKPLENGDRQALQQQIRSHLRLALVLVSLVGLNVLCTFLPLDRTPKIALQVALAVLSGGIVLAFFMHLLTEKMSTLIILACTAVLFAALMALPIFAGHDHPEMTESHSAPPAPAAKGHP
jgi:cytochrome c oxidase subunit IV